MSQPIGAGSMDVSQLLESMGGAERVAQEMESFRETAQLLSSHQGPRIIERYPGQWIALHNRQVCAHGKTREEVLAEVVELGIPPGRALLRFINDKPRTMILAAR